MLWGNWELEGKWERRGSGPHWLGHGPLDIHFRPSYVPLHNWLLPLLQKDNLGSDTLEFGAQVLTSPHISSLKLLAQNPLLADEEWGRGKRKIWISFPSWKFWEMLQICRELPNSPINILTQAKVLSLPSVTKSKAEWCNTLEGGILTFVWVKNREFNRKQHFIPKTLRGSNRQVLSISAGDVTWLHRHTQSFPNLLTLWYINFIMLPDSGA